MWNVEKSWLILKSECTLIWNRLSTLWWTKLEDKCKVLDRGVHVYTTTRLLFAKAPSTLHALYLSGNAISSHREHFDSTPWLWLFSIPKKFHFRTRKHREKFDLNSRSLLFLTAKCSQINSNISIDVHFQQIRLDPFKIWVTFLEPRKSLIGRALIYIIDDLFYRRQNTR